MKKFLIIGVIIVFIIIIFVWAKNSYNGMVVKEEVVTSQWAQVENVYQRRLDLIPNLVETVKGYATHENKTLTAVIEARAKATQVTIDPTKLNEQNIEMFQKAQGEVSSTLSRLMVSMEAYPDLKANQNFLNLQSQLETTENGIKDERAKFNEVVKDFNMYVRKFPKNIFASIFGFEQKAYFKAEEGANKAPKVQF